MTGSRTDGGRAGWDRELAEVASLALPGEQVPVLPAMISNTKAAVAAYAEAVSDGVADELRRRLFGAIWVQGLNLSSPYEVRRLVTAVMWPQEDITDRLASPDLPSLLLHGSGSDPDRAPVAAAPSRRDGEPLTTAGWRRIRQWRQEWLALPSQVVPRGHRPGPGRAARHRRAALPGRSRPRHWPPAAPARACRNRAAPGRPACGGRPGGLTGLPART